jgi:hypothetical protein
MMKDPDIFRRSDIPILSENHPYFRLNAGHPATLLDEVFSYFYNKENKQCSQLFLPVYNYVNHRT